MASKAADSKKAGDKKADDKKTDRASESETRHGATMLPAVTLDSFNLELRTREGFLGDRASKRAFWDIVENARKPLRKAKEDPFGDISTDDITKKQLDEILADGDGEAAGLVIGAVEEFAGELAGVIKKFLGEKGWERTERLAVGGGMRAGRVGELAIGRAGVLLKTDGVSVDLVPIRHDPDDAGLIGCAHLTPRWTLKGYDAILAIDIGGTNMRAGVVELNASKKSNFAKASVWRSKIWRHADDEPSRTAAVERLVKMLEDLIEHARDEKLALAPFIGIGCPGVIAPDGAIEKGGQNLPGGNWESEHFNLPKALRKAIPNIDGEDTHITMHNDAVVQGLSQTPFMDDVERWGVITIGTGLGNARFTNRGKDD